jgi:hypothetical protein
MKKRVYEVGLVKGWKRGCISFELLVMGDVGY